MLEQLPAHTVDASVVKREPPRFYLFLRDFDLSKQKGELSGAAYQGTVFGYLRADAAHLQVEVEKVRTGGKRVGKIADVEARDGELLVLSAEVKQYTVQPSEVSGFEQFAHQVKIQGALGLVVALDFADGARDALHGMGLEAVSKAGSALGSTQANHRHSGPTLLRSPRRTEYSAIRKTSEISRISGSTRRSSGA